MPAHPIPPRVMPAAARPRHTPREIAARVIDVVPLEEDGTEDGPYTIEILGVRVGRYRSDEPVTLKAEHLRRALARLLEDPQNDANWRLP